MLDVAQEYYEKSVLNMPLGEEAFQGCTSLTSVVIPESVTMIDYNAFAYCTSLTSGVIPEGVTEIGFGAFDNCNLTSVVIPASVKSIAYNAFGEHVEIIRE